jgi:hypothetical protein
MKTQRLGCRVNLNPPRDSVTKWEVSCDVCIESGPDQVDARLSIS